MTSTTHGRAPSQTRSTPNRPRRPNAAARCAQISRAASPSARALGLGQPRRHDVPAPPVAADAQRAAADELLADAEQRRGAPVGDGRRRARQPRDALLDDDARRQPPAAPLAHAAAAAAADRLAQPAARAVGPRRRVGGGERARVREPGGAQRGAEHAPGRARAERLRGAAEQRAPGREPRDEVGPVLEPGAVDDASAAPVRRRPRAPPSRLRVEVAQERHARAQALQVEVAEAVEGEHLVPVARRELGQHARADRDEEDQSRPSSCATNSTAVTRSAVVPG